MSDSKPAPTWAEIMDHLWGLARDDSASVTDRIEATNALIGVKTMELRERGFLQSVED